MKRSLAVPGRDQSRPEEVANSLSHGVGLAAALCGTPFLILSALKNGDAGYIVGTGIFSATMIILYLASTLYHALHIGKAKAIFRVIEHSAIYLLIAGTYTPFTLGVLRGPWGWTLLGIIWTLAFIGVALKLFGRVSHPIVSLFLYLMMGWTIMIAIKPMLAQVPVMGLILLLAGGLSYTSGVVFFATDAKLKYGHFIWHLFVLAGTGCHYFSILWYAF